MVRMAAAKVRQLVVTVLQRSSYDLFANPTTDYVRAGEGTNVMNTRKPSGEVTLVYRPKMAMKMYSTYLDGLTSVMIGTSPPTWVNLVTRFQLAPSLTESTHHQSANTKDPRLYQSRGHFVDPKVQSS